MLTAVLIALPAYSGIGRTQEMSESVSINPAAADVQLIATDADAHSMTDESRSDISQNATREVNLDYGFAPSDDVKDAGDYETKVRVYI